ncbi:hypothetical protein H5410_056410 [Solanum commersonii]|uniref:Uncharacterized protein n=1 Tax=Solanum commersonii TaxID=4109 RepID=A0A9J5WM64_SOLCO|nr:hypothetical protein H5410_056410 [Solanum commersonii]
MKSWREVAKNYQRWKSQYLSLGGRLTLIESGMDALPIYMMSLFPIPKSIEKKINMLRRSFLWQGSKEKRGYNLVKWDTLTLNKNHGGLGIKNLNIQNESLMQKALWRRFIAEKYGLLNLWSTEEVLGTFGCCVWKSIRRLWPQFYTNISFKVGDGVRIDFWNELWIGENNLRILFPRLYVLSSQKNALVSQV